MSNAPKLEGEIYTPVIDIVNRERLFRKSLAYLPYANRVSFS